MHLDSTSLVTVDYFFFGNMKVGLIHTGGVKAKLEILFEYTKQ